MLPSQPAVQPQYIVLTSPLRSNKVQSLCVLSAIL